MTKQTTFTSFDTSEPIKAEALSLINLKLTQESNKILHLIKAIDEELKEKVAYYLCAEHDKQPHSVQFAGYPASKTMIKECPTWIKTIEFANSNKIMMESLTIPWQRVVSIKNMSYKAKV